MSLASLRNFTDEEFILYLDKERHRSPIIGELCKRLESLLEADPRDVSSHVECPVCLAGLDANYDSANEILNVIPSK